MSVLHALQSQVHVAFDVLQNLGTCLVFGAWRIRGSHHLKYFYTSNRKLIGLAIVMHAIQSFRMYWVIHIILNRGRQDICIENCITHLWYGK